MRSPADDMNDLKSCRDNTKKSFDDVKDNFYNAFFNEIDPSTLPGPLSIRDEKHPDKWYETEYAGNLPSDLPEEIKTAKITDIRRFFNSWVIEVRT